MRIILNADDFGHSVATVQATIDCFAQGALSSASIMPRMPATQQALAFARAHPEWSFGVHLTFVTDDEERPLLPPARLPHLCRPDGRFRSSNQVRLLGLLRRIPPDEIAREMEAQLAFVRDHGVPISHVDSHGHTHKFAPFRQALEQVLPRFSVRRVRNVQDLYLRRPLRSPTFWLGPMWRRALMARFVTTDQFFMPTSAGDVAWAEPLLRAARGPTLEVGVHPGPDGGEPFRAAERRELLHLAALLRGSGHTIISWRDL
ncbi:MAG: ChbG/HpnK family deacetylase [Myxococcales bacterium]|nr:ChbG/HpnK family deacetylase [Myxococcota bacterium]MDW8282625.1 ChbG/HpnK family deacetylase [Myxococcales bacterium]